MSLSYIDVAIKLTIGILTLTLVINISGKSNLAPNSASDQIQNYVLGTIIGGVIYNPAITILQYIIILLIWTILVLLKWLKANVLFVKNILGGKPLVIIRHGKINVSLCRSAELSAGDIVLKLRGKGVTQINQVKMAVLEQNGQLIVAQKGEQSPRFPIILDGVIQMDMLESMDKDRDWLISKLNDQGIVSPNEVFVAKYSNGEVFTVLYE